LKIENLKSKITSCICFGPQADYFYGNTAPQQKSDDFNQTKIKIFLIIFQKKTGLIYIFIFLTLYFGSIESTVEYASSNLEDKYRLFSRQYLSKILTLTDCAEPYRETSGATYYAQSSDKEFIINESMAVSVAKKISGDSVVFS
jgi:hypothetical protein